MDFKLIVPTHILSHLSIKRVLFVIFAIFTVCNTVYNISSYRHHQKKIYTHQTLALPHIDVEQAAAVVIAPPASPAPPTPTAPTKVEAAVLLKKTEPTWIIVTTQPRDTLGSVFKKQGLSQKNLQIVLHEIQHPRLLANIKPQQKIQVLKKNGELEKMILPVNATQFLVVSRDKNRYVSQLKLRAMESRDQYVTATLRGSLYGTAKRHNIPYQLIQQMVSIFTWDLDFSHAVREGDQFSILYSAHYINNKLVGTGDILAVSYNNRGKIHQAIRHAHASGGADYFTPDGHSLRKAFSRYPVNFSRISSSFSLSRVHPILHYRRPHRGIDLAAPLGTPIRATGDGRIALMGREHGYGNVIKITHQQTYTSVYAHLLRFQRGLKRGNFVQRGQIIGYVGQSGLANGPHCHYEFHINHHPQNPSTVALPRASPVPAREALAFRRHAQQMLASLKLYESSQFARGPTHRAHA